MQRIDEIANTCLTRIQLFAAFHSRDLDEVLSVIKLAMETYANEQKQPKTDPYYDTTFKAFYEKYGKKVGRVVAYRRWCKLKKSDIETIQDTIDDFVLAHPDPQYRPHPATYIAQKRWLDELTTRKQRVVANELKGRENTWKYEA